MIAGIIGALADERHGPDVYESTFKYVLGSLAKVDDALLAQNIAHFKMTAAARSKAWELKAIQSKVFILSTVKTKCAIFDDFAMFGSLSCKIEVIFDT
jgi:hypothetical protein